MVTTVIKQNVHRPITLVNLAVSVTYDDWTKMKYTEAYILGKYVLTEV